ncbi:hypothetical protein ACVMB2_003475 [Sinorhizobium meliloti]
MKPAHRTEFLTVPPDKLGSKAVAQEMCTCDPPEFDPAMPQPLPHDP